MDRTCGKHVRNKNAFTILVRKLKGGIQMRKTDINGTIILKLILKE
jgi:S-adenosylmethionine/arginine decarboxylase-like enzyme